MSGLDIEGVLAGHEDWDHWSGENRCLCGAVLTVPDFALSEQIAAAHRAHVAAVLREQIAAWLGSDDAEESVYEALDPGGYGWAAGDSPSVRETIRTLAALVARVDPSPSESGSTDPEVRQSADRTSSPSRVPREET